MKLLNTIVIFLAAFFSPIISQTVTTLVPGTSTFNDGLAIDKYGNIYASLYYGQTVTKIKTNGQANIFAQGFSSPNGLAFGPDGYLYVPSVNNDIIFRVDIVGNVEEYISISKPHALYFDKDGLLYVASYTDSKIYTIDQNKTVTQIFSGGFLNGPIGILKDSAGILYIGNFNNGKIYKVNENNSFTQIGAIPGWLGFMTIIDDYIYATAYQANKIYKVAIDGSGQTVFAGNGKQGNDDGPALEASFNNPNGIAATATGDTLYVSDYSSRALRMITGVRQTTTSANSNNELPSEFSLEQNYPNPFNPTTIIKYSLPEAAFVNITVHNLLGETVKTLINKNQNPGNFEIRFDAPQLSSGVYIYKLTAGSYSISKKMVLTK